MVEWTTIDKAHSKSRSCRVTVPRTVLDVVGLEAGDRVGWVICAVGEGVFEVKLLFEKRVENGGGD